MSALKENLRGMLRAAAMPVLHWSGLGAAYALVSRSPGAVVLMYHSVAAEAEADAVDPANRIAPALFERQMSFLKRRRRVISLTELVTRIQAGQAPQAGTVCLTFDDGYLDNLKVAAPILDHYRLPATLFLATGYVARGEPQWSDVLHWMFRRRTRDGLDLRASGAKAYSLRVAGEHAAARRVLHRCLLEATYPERTRLLQEVARQLQPDGSLPRLTLTWDEARDMQRRYPLFEFGGHTRDHLDLRTHRGLPAQAEITGCADDLRRELGLEPGHFSFPYGRACEATRAMVRAGGWRSTVASGHRLRVDAASDPHGLSRGETPESLGTLGFMTGGAYPRLYPDLLKRRGNHD